MTESRKYIYRFSEGNAQMRNLLGGKGANLSEMVGLGLPVPPGFIITTDVSLEYYKIGKKMPDGLWEDIQAHMHELEANVGRKLGDADNPLLVSVRSGSRFSMPGMMDTILNLGVNDQVVEGLTRQMDDRRPAFDAYRRFLQIFGNVAMEVPSSVFEEILEECKRKAGVQLDHELSVDQLVPLVDDFKKAILQHVGGEVPSDPWEQLRQAVLAVFESWNNPRATEYRNYRGIPHDLGTAVNIMAMVFGNTGNDSGTGVLFTRNPATGERHIYGEYLANAQGEDVVAGVRTPEHVSQMASIHPQIYQQLTGLAQQLETHYRDVQDVEFTVERGRLYLLQTRSAQRTAAAAVRAAVDMTEEKLITKDEAIQRVDPEEMSRLLVPRFDEQARADAVSQGALLARGTPASPGAATGHVYFDATEAAEAGKSGESVILVRSETNPNDINGILQSVGILTSRGGTTSHAAVVTRGLGKVCIVGTEEISFSRGGASFEARGQVV
ncbi:MAG: pyruvate, phosphate dikinase, partial [Dehalococcoidia bacterium]